MKDLSHWCRYVMDESIHEYMRTLDFMSLSVLEISGDKWSEFGFQRYQTANFPEFDVCKDRLDEKFDIVIAEQVFEHIRYPARAAKNVYKMLKPGGIFVISTPFLIKFHPHPQDLWRWTADGMRYFLEDSGFFDVTTDSWGNKPCVIANLDNWDIYDAECHSLENKKQYPVVVWGTARRPRVIERFKSWLKA